MDKNRAISLLDETFNNQFDQNNFLIFIKELFNEFKFVERSSDVWNEYQDYIESYVNFGTYVDTSRKVVDILVIKLKRTSSRDRARTMQRNFVAKYLGNAEKDAALVAFYGDDPQDWRFSFVKMEYQLVKETDGKVKIIKELTPAKRYSFLVGVNEPNHTCKSQFVSLLLQEEVNPTLEEIEAAFTIDKVTKEFFIEYKALYLKLKEAVENFIKKDKNIKEEFEDKAISVIDFAKKLLGQIVFIYFLQKKGWLGVEKDKGKFKDWGTGPKKFLRKLFEKKDYDNFFNDVLEPLFYEALATERDDDYYSKFECKIPFLNGGLFEPINDYNWRETDLLLRNDIFEQILDTFDRYNFTVKEDEPLEKEVAIDPEMLGKVFENLIEENIRKGQGAYYTPREIVNYMCQQSLINYLETNTGINREDIEKFIQLGDFALDILIKEKEKIRRYGRSYITDEEHKLSKSIRENYAKIDELLKNIKIVDPAVGSGAFPVGMMNEIVRARQILSMFFSEDEQKARTNYHLKREIIENCLYGVDIDSSAVDIAKLRFWLSLIVDETNMKNIQPLPNLDHKIMCGNSLLEEFEGHKLFDDKLLGEVKNDYSFEIKQIDSEIAKLNQEKGEIARGKLKNGKSIKDIDKDITSLIKKKQKILSAPKNDERNATFEEIVDQKIKESQKKLKELKELQHKFFNEQNRKLKKQHRDEIEKIEWEFIEETLKEQGHEDSIKKLEQYKKNKSKPFFLWKLYFAEVFQRENPGFDVVIANPPYVEHKKLKEFSRIFKRNYNTYSGTADIYVYFYELSFNILRKNGVLTFITSNKFMRTSYGENLRGLLSSRYMLEIIDFTKFHVFDALVSSSVIISLNRENSEKEVKTLSVGEDFSLNYSLFGYIKNNSVFYPQNKFGSEIWNLLSADLLKIKEKIDSIGRRIEEIDGINVYRGVTIGYNQAFIVEGGVKKRLIEADKMNADIIKPILQGRNIKKWAYNRSNEYLLLTNYDLDIPNKYPAIFKHLLSYKEDLIKRKDQGKKWWNLRACKYYAEFEKEKIIWGLTADKWAFCYDNKKNFLPSNGYFLVSAHIPLNIILGQLNSRLLEFYFGTIGIMTAGGAFTLKYDTIVELPIKWGDKLIDSKVIQLVDKILSITKDDDYLDNLDKQSKVKKLEKEIDQLIYKLYELAPEEIEIVENFDRGKNE